MHRPSFTVLPALLGALLFVATGMASAADMPQKTPPRRLPPNAADSVRIPAGVDTGSPATTDAVPLGTPVPPTGAVGRNDQNKRGAAARAAARPKAVAASDAAATAVDAAASAGALAGRSRAGCTPTSGKGRREGVAAGASSPKSGC